MYLGDSLLLQRIEHLAKQARQAEEGRDYSRAASLYAQLAQWEEEYAIRYASDPKARATWKERATMHRRYADQVAKGPPATAKSPPAEDSGSSLVGTSVSGDAAGLLAVVDGLIVMESPARWEDIAGLEEAQRDVKMAFALALAQKPQGTRLPTWGRILLYGPPGTGKTLLASAVAGSIPGSTFFNAQWSQLASKWYGETAKLVSLLYQRAREKAPSVAFLDEVDTIAARRDESGRHEATVASLNALLQELSGIHDKLDERFVLTFAATNRPWSLDDAFLSRFAKAIYVPLPDIFARQQIFRIHLEKNGILVAVPYEDLAGLTEGYSGREIAALCTQAVMIMVQEQNPSLMDLVDKGVDALRAYSLSLRPIVRENFTRALASIRPMSTPEMLRAFQEWRKERGFS